MRPLVIVEASPFGELLFEIQFGIFEIEGAVKLFLVRLLASFHLSVEMWSPGTIRAIFDEVAG